MDDHAEFDSVSWRNEPESNASRPNTAESRPSETDLAIRSTNGNRNMSSHPDPQGGPLPDAVDLGGIGDGALECTVDSPMKENDGTKDAYISYLVSTHVRPIFHRSALM